MKDGPHPVETCDCPICRKVRGLFVRQKIWYAPMILVGMKAVILKTWLRGWFKLILYRDPLNGKCYKEWVAGENYNIFERE